MLADISGKVLRLGRQRSSKINDCHYTESGLLIACQHTVKLQTSLSGFRGGVLSLLKARLRTEFIETIRRVHWMQRHVAGGVLSLPEQLGNEKCLEVVNSRKFHAIIQA